MIRSARFARTASLLTAAVVASAGIATATAGSAAAAPPSNDAFANATTLTLNTPTQGTLVDATVEVGEGLGDCTSSGTPPTRSVWFRYTAPVDGTLVVGTAPGSANPVSDVDTVINVWTGTSFPLTAVTCADDKAGGSYSLTDGFAATASTTYWFQVLPWNTLAARTGPFSIAVGTTSTTSGLTLAGVANAQSVSLTATASHADASTPGGAVYFYEQVPDSATVAVPFSGTTASTTLANVTPGPHVYRAVYDPRSPLVDGVYSDIVEVTAAVAPPTPTPTPTPVPVTSTTSVKAPAKVTKGKKASATVTVTTGTGPAAGAVTATVKGKTVGSATLVGGVATFSLGKIKKKTTVVVSFAGSATTLASTGQATVKVKKPKKK